VAVRRASSLLISLNTLKTKKNVVISLEKKRKNKKILNYIVLRGLEPLNASRQVVDARKTPVTWHVHSHARCRLVLMGQAASSWMMVVVSWQSRVMVNVTTSYVDSG
jgi:hypothetical protein